MPRVPSAQLSSGGLPGFQAPATVPVQNQSGQEIRAIGRQVENLGTSLFMLSEQEQATLLTARMREHKLRMSSTVDKALHDPGSGYLTRVGKDAVNGYEGFIRDLRNEMNSAGTENMSEIEREKYRAQRDSLLIDAESRARRHASEQTQAWAIGTAKAEVSNLRDEYSRAVQGGDADGAHVARHLLASNIEELGDLLGWSEEQQEQARREELTNLHSQTFAMLADDDRLDDAGDYLRDNGDEMDRRALSGLRQTLRAKKDARDRREEAEKLATTSRDRAFRIMDEVQGDGEPMEMGLGRIVEMRREGKLSEDDYAATLSRYGQEMRNRQTVHDGEVAQFWRSLSESGARSFDAMPEDLRRFASENPDVATSLTKLFSGIRDDEAEQAWRSAIRMPREEFLKAYPTKDAVSAAFGVLTNEKLERVEGRFDLFTGNETASARSAEVSDIVDKRLMQQAWTFRRYDDEGEALTSKSAMQRAGIDPDIRAAIMADIRQQGEMTSVQVGEYLDKLFEDADWHSDEWGAVPRRFWSHLPTSVRSTMTRKSAFGEISGYRAESLAVSDPAYSSWLRETASRPVTSTGGEERAPTPVEVERRMEELDRELANPTSKSEAIERMSRLRAGYTEPGTADPITMEQARRLASTKALAADAWLQQQGLVSLRDPDILPGQVKWAVREFDLTDAEERELQRIIEVRKLRHGNRGGWLRFSSTRNPYPTQRR